MNGELMTFGELRDRLMIDICGGIIEFSTRILIRRGTLTGILYWPDKSPRQFDLEQTIFWKKRGQRWRNNSVTDTYLMFNFGEAENFIGPFETKGGEIVFMLRDTHCVTIFPKGVPVPARPQEESGYHALQRMMTPMPIL